MITQSDIDKIAKSMKIEIDNNTKYINDIKNVIQYFNMLDNVDVNSIKIETMEITIESLREDKYIEYRNKLIYKLKTTKSIFLQKLLKVMLFHILISMF